MLSSLIRDLSYHMGLSISNHPTPYLLLPLILFASFIHSAHDALRNSLSNIDSSMNEELFLPDNGRIREIKEKLAIQFPDGGYFSTRSWLAPNLRIVVLEVEKGKNVLDDTIMEKYIELRNRLDLAEIMTSRGRVSVSLLCSRMNNQNGTRNGILPRRCKSDVLSILNVMGDITYPYANITLGILDPVNGSLYRQVNVSPYLGDVHLTGDGKIKRARLSRIIFDLPKTNWMTKNEWIDLDNEWMKIIDKFEMKNENQFKVYFWSPLQYDKDVKSVGKSTTRLIPVLISVLLIFSIVVTINYRLPIRSKPWVALAGVISPALGISTSIGILHICGMPLIPIALLTPFLVLSVGIDDMFIMLSIWGKTRHNRPEAEIDTLMAETYRESSVSIILTTLSNVLVYGTGCISSLPAVRLFCIHCSLSMALVFLFQVTFFGSVLSLDGRRELCERHPLFLTKKKNNSLRKRRSIATSFSTLSLTPSESILDRLSPSRIFNNPWCLIPIGISYILYCGGCFYTLTFELKEGLELSSLLPEGTRTHSYLTVYERYFTGGTPLEVLLPSNIDYSNPSVRYSVLTRIHQLESSTQFTMDFSYWLPDFIRYVNTVYGLDVPIDKGKFIDLLVKQFLQHPLYRDYSSDVRIENGTIVSSRLFIPLRRINTTTRIIAEKKLREESETDLIVFDVSFGLAEQSIELPFIVGSNLLLAGGATVFSLLILMPTTLNCILMTWAVLSINAGVFGVLAHLGSRFDVISVITSLLSIGYSLDFSSHVLAHFHQLRPSPIGSTLSIIGKPILYSASSTILGVASLMPLKGYIIENLIRTIISVCIIGTYHSIILVPAILQRFL